MLKYNLQCTVNNEKTSPQTSAWIFQIMQLYFPEKDATKHKWNIGTRLFLEILNSDHSE